MLVCLAYTCQFPACRSLCSGWPLQQNWQHGHTCTCVNCTQWGGAAPSQAKTVEGHNCTHMERGRGHGVMRTAVCRLTVLFCTPACRRTVLQRVHCSLWKLPESSTCPQTAVTNSTELLAAPVTCIQASCTRTLKQHHQSRCQPWALLLSGVQLACQLQPGCWLS